MKIGQLSAVSRADPDIHGDWAGEAPGVAQRSREGRDWSGGGGLEGDGEAECFELADVIAFGRFGTPSLGELQTKAPDVNRPLLDTERVGQGCVLASQAS